MILGRLLFGLIAMLHCCASCSAQKADTPPRKYNKPLKYPPEVHRMYRERLIKKTPPKIIGHWSAWSEWTPCSRSCGGGITQQTRNCITRPADSRFVKRQRRRRQSQKQPSGCVGLYKRIHMCNNQNCPSGTDFRYEQCAAFNNRPFRGTYHKWEPFLKVKDECALNCRPAGMNFAATLNRTVIDGTPCQYPVTHTGKAAPRGTKGVCIEGYCKTVNSHGVVGNLDEFQETELCSSCQKTTCRTFNGIYTKAELPPGYSLVAQIPTGACKIHVQQLEHSRNFLALKNTDGSFFVNGDWKFSSSRVFQGAGTKFVYIRQDENSLETLSSPGPLANGIDIMIVSYQPNTGIKYSYSLPISEAPSIAPPLIKRPTANLETGLIETRRIEIPLNPSTNQRDEARPPFLSPGPRRTRQRRKHFHWKITGLTACSKSCGGGIQTYVKTCTREISPHNTIPVHDRRCAHLNSSAPAPIPCNTDPCPPTWEHYWTDCSVTCGEGVQQFIPICKQVLASGSVTLTDIKCSKPKPAMQSRPCRKASCESILNNELPQANNHDRYGWVTGPWSACSVSCGTGHKTRAIHCSTDPCKNDDKPSHSEYCNMGPCPSQLSSSTTFSEFNSRSQSSLSSWWVTDWSQCSEACGTGNQKRLAMCGSQNRDTCTKENKPELSRACSSEKQCNGQWFTGPWGACSDSCSGRASQKREVFCIVKIRGQSHITNEMTCSTHLKPIDEQACEGSCPPHWFFGDWGPCEGACPNGVQRREVRCMDIYERQTHGCPEEDMPVAKRTCACQSKSDSRERYKPAQDEPADRSCVDRIRKCKLAVQARLCHYPYYITYCCESCRRAQDYSD